MDLVSQILPSYFFCLALSLASCLPALLHMDLEQAALLLCIPSRVCDGQTGAASPSLTQLPGGSEWTERARAAALATDSRLVSYLPVCPPPYLTYYDIRLSPLPPSLRINKTSGRQ